MENINKEQGELNNSETEAEHADNAKTDEKYFVKGASKANLTDEMRRLGGRFDDETMEWYFTEPWKAYEALLLIDKGNKQK